MRVNGWHGALLVAVLWLTARPYSGLVHDGILYFAQALSHLRPGALDADLFFAYGSQDRFTVFARVLALLYARWDVPTVQIATLTACHGALLVLLWMLLRSLSSFERCLGLCALAVFSHQYGGHAIFAFAERFVTARSLAEPLALAALLALVLGRSKTSVVLLIATTMVHPLIGVGAGMVAWCWACIGDLRWLGLVVLTALPMLAAWFGLEPFDRVLLGYDEIWWESVQRVSGHVLISTWGVVDASIIAIDVGLLMLAMRWLGQPLARLCMAALAATGVLVFVSWVGADLLRNQLITQLQLWRVLWLVHMLALAMAPALIVHAWRLGGRGRALGMAIAGCLVVVTARWNAGWAFVLFAALAWWLTHGSTPMSPGLERWWTRASAAALVLASFAVVVENAELLRESGTSLGPGQLVRLAVTMPLLSMTAAALVLKFGASNARWGVATAAALMFALVLSATNWDRRAPMNRAIESDLHAEHPFRSHVPGGAQVLWWGYPAASWVFLQRPSFWSVHQGSGLLFHRETAIEFSRRSKMVAVFELQETVCAATAALNNETQRAEEDCMPTREAMSRVCREPGGPDFLVFRRRLEGALGAWTAGSSTGVPGPTWYLYDCIQLR